MSALATQPRIARPDDVYQLLVDTYDGLSDAEAARFHASLVLILINQIGDNDIVGDAIAEASRMVRQRRSS